MKAKPTYESPAVVRHQFYMESISEFIHPARSPAGLYRSSGDFRHVGRSFRATAYDGGEDLR